MLEELTSEDIDGSLDLGSLEQILEKVAGPEAVLLLRDSFLATLLRAIEMALLSDPEVLSLVRAPAVYLGRERAVLSQVFSKMGLSQVHEDVMALVVDAVRGRVAHRDTKGSSDVHFASVASDHLSKFAQFRCCDCGYHFRAEDLGQDRRQIAIDLGVRFAQTTPPQRFRDPWKPATEHYRKLTVDHIRPEAALGPTAPSNLRLLCGFCNLRRQIARRQFEVTSPRISAGLFAVVGGTRGQWAVEAAVYFAVCTQQSCSVCQAESITDELTAVSVVGNVRWTGILPWQLEVRCYEHSGY